MRKNCLETFQDCKTKVRWVTLLLVLMVLMGILVMLVMVLMSRKLFNLFDQMLVGQKPKFDSGLLYLRS